MRTRSLGILFFLFLAGLPVARGALPTLPPDLAGDAEARGFADLLFSHGMVSLSTGDVEAALQSFERAGTTWPADPTYRYFAAHCLLRLGQLDDSIRALEELLPPTRMRVPESRLRYELGDAYYRKGDLQRAEREFRSAVELNREDALAHFYLGITLLRLGRDEEALAELGRGAALDPAVEASSSYYLGTAAARRGDTEKARAWFEQAVATSPGTDLAARSSDWLRLLDAPVKGAEVPRVDFRVGLSTEYDDNPLRAPDTFADTESDFRGVLSLRLAAYPLVNHRGWTLGLLGRGYSSRHQDVGEADVSGLQGVFQAAWGANRLGYFHGPLGLARVPVGDHRVGLLFQAGGSFFEQDGESARRDYSSAVGLLIHEGRRATTQVDVEYADRTFFEETVYLQHIPFLGPVLDTRTFQDFSGKTTTARVGQYFFLGKEPHRYLRVAAEHTEITAAAQGLERDRDRFLVELALPLGRRWALFLFGSYAEVDWDDASAQEFVCTGLLDLGLCALALGGDPEPRKDTLRQARASVVVDLARQTYLRVHYSWTDNEVTPNVLQEAYGFERTSVSAGLVFHW